MIIGFKINQKKELLGVKGIFVHCFLNYLIMKK